LQALILAGGLGTRLRHVVSDRPKPMALVNGKPFLEYQIEFLRKNNIDDIVLSVGYMSEKIEKHFGSGKNFGISIRYVREKDFLGTGGAIKNAIQALNDYFFALNGDSLFLVDLDSMIKFHKDNQAEMTIALAKVGDNSRYGNIHVSNKFQITEFTEKGNSSEKLINGGIYYFRKDTWNWKNFPEKFSLEKEFFPQIVTKNRIFGYLSDSYFIDIGTVEDYKKLESDVSSGTIKL